MTEKTIQDKIEDIITEARKSKIYISSIDVDWSVHKRVTGGKSLVFLNEIQTKFRFFPDISSSTVAVD